jgi:fluoride exporter
VDPIMVSLPPPGRPVPEHLAGLGRGDRLRLLVANLPVDPDLAPDVVPPPSRAVATAAVAAGGVAGALGRAGLSVALPHDPGEWPLATLLTNLSGAVALAVLLVVLGERRPGSRYLRPLLGTGVLGGYTTFSTLSVDVVDLARGGSAWAAPAYVGASLVGMLAAAVAGLLVARTAVRLAAPHRWHRQLERARDEQ